MKVQITIFLFVLALSKSAAQIPDHFAPIGTRWEYNLFSYLSEYGKLIYESVGDTLINGTKHRVIKTTSRTSACEVGCPLRTYSDSSYYTVRNDSLLRINWNGEYLFMFNFNYRIGDTISLSTNGRISPPKGIVSRVVYALINNKRLRFWEISQTCTNKIATQKVFELIGLVDNTFYDLLDRCQSGDTFRTLCEVQSDGWVYSPQICRYSVPTNEVEPTAVTIYPNPANAQLTVNYTTDNQAFVPISLVIHDIVGKIVYEKPLDALKNIEPVDISNLAKGIYTLSIQVIEKKVFTKRFVKL